jgi:competence ComEA-like helix-hairpin-helix protein
MNACLHRRRWLFLLLLGLLSLAGLAADQEKKPPQGKKDPPAKPLDINQATVEELQKLPEVGAKLAAAIVRFREKSGPFRRVEELLAVPGITRRRLEKIRPHVMVKGAKEKPLPAAST